MLKKLRKRWEIPFYIVLIVFFIFIEVGIYPDTFMIIKNLMILFVTVPLLILDLYRFCRRKRHDN